MRVVQGSLIRDSGTESGEYDGKEDGTVHMLWFYRGFP